MSLQNVIGVVRELGCRDSALNMAREILPIIKCVNGSPIGTVTDADAATLKAASLFLQFLMGLGDDGKPMMKANLRSIWLTC